MGRCGFVSEGMSGTSSSEIQTVGCPADYHARPQHKATVMRRSLAPMVRLGTLPLRLLSLERGAEIVFTEELPAPKLALCTRLTNRRLGTIDWVLRSRGEWSAFHETAPASACVLRTTEKEAGRLVVQLGCSGEDDALAAANALFGDESKDNVGILGVDLNLGCPQRAAIDGGSGVALFNDPPRSQAVVRTLRKACPKNVIVSCKIRLCDEGPEETFTRCKNLVEAGVEGLEIHARRPEERCHDALARWREVGEVAQALAKAFPDDLRWIMVNGDALEYEAACEMRAASTCNHILVGRGALLAGPIFEHISPTKQELEGCTKPASSHSHDAFKDLSTLELCRRYVRIATEYENAPLNSAFVLQWMIHARLRERAYGTSIMDALQPCPLAQAAEVLMTATTAQAVCDALGEGEFFRSMELGHAAAPAHRYSPDFFEPGGLSWRIMGPPPGAYAEARKMGLMDSVECLPARTNEDFRQLVTEFRNPKRSSFGSLDVPASDASAFLARALLITAAATDLGLDGEDTADAKHGWPKRCRLDDPESARARLEGLSRVAPRYSVVRRANPSERRLGYFATAWLCRCRVGEQNSCRLVITEAVDLPMKRPLLWHSKLWLRAMKTR